LALVRNVAFTLHFGAKLLAFCVAVRCLLWMAPVLMFLCYHP
jgi:hypothetical protein